VSRPGKPTDNAFCESFNGRVRAEFLNPSYFENLAQVRRATGIWRQDYNEFRPHSTLDNLTPIAYAQKAIDRRKSWFFTVALGPKIGLGSSKPMHHSCVPGLVGATPVPSFRKNVWRLFGVAVQLGVGVHHISRRLRTSRYEWSNARALLLSTTLAYADADARLMSNGKLRACSSRSNRHVAASKSFSTGAALLAVAFEAAVRRLVPSRGAAM